MVGAVLLGGLLITVGLGLLVPAKTDPNHLFDRLRTEYSATSETWNETTARRVLERGGQLFDLVGPVAAGNAPSRLGATEPSNALAQAVDRLLASTYFRGIDAMLMLAAFRLSLLLEWLAWLGLLLAAAVFDAVMVRAVRSREVRASDPETYALAAGAGAGLLSLLVAGLVAPVTLPPWSIPAVASTMLWCIGVSVARYHRSP